MEKFPMSAASISRKTIGVISKAILRKLLGKERVQGIKGYISLKSNKLITLLILINTFIL